MGESRGRAFRAEGKGKSWRGYLGVLLDERGSEEAGGKQRGGLKGSEATSRAVA